MSKAWLRSLSLAAALGLVALQTAVTPFGPAAGAQTMPAPPAGTDKLLDGLSTLVVPPGTTAERSKRAIFAKDATSVAIDATAAGSAAVLLADLEKLGLTDGVAFGRMVSGRLPISSLVAAADLPSLKFARPVQAGTGVGNVDSQGDAAMGTDVLRAAQAVDGTGVVVGTMSDSYDCLGGAAGDVASNDLPAGVNNLDEGPCAGATDEGRAMMQLVHDVAPGAQLLFHNAFEGQAHFAQGILDLQAAGADIVNDDIFYFAEPFYQDGIIAQAVDQVVTGGVAYFSLAGNFDRQAYESGFRDSGNNGCGGRLHDFDPGPGVDTAQQITIPAGQGVTLSFQWDQPFFSVSGAPGSANNMDLCLLDNTNAVVATGANNNVGGDPVEVVTFTNPMAATSSTFTVQLSRVAGANPGRMKYMDYSSNVTINEFATNSSTLVAHANATNAEAVGAAFYNNTPVFGTNPPVRESFSSGGGTPILFDTAGNAIAPVVRNKPRIVAPDGTNTTFFGNDIPDPGNGSDTDAFPNFFGTSAATPHAAAFAALLLDANPALTPAQIYTQLETTAIDMGPAGFDFDTGFGFIQAQSILGVACAAPPPPGPGAIIVAAPGQLTVGTPGDDVIYGTAGADRIAGLGGNDTIFGQGGVDQLAGGEGNDILCGGPGGDFLDGGNGDDTLSGDADNDDLAGGAGADQLFGGLGVDRVNGGPGTDVCAGGGQAGDQTGLCP
ncbi:MAG TPA: S8 family serine peptidase [Acidimicrobiales bacterium]|nr:S8 family serine peptidase [Acidimicrobiales bacterium]